MRRIAIPEIPHENFVRRYQWKSKERRYFETNNQSELRVYVKFLMINGVRIAFCHIKIYICQRV